MSDENVKKDQPEEGPEAIEVPYCFVPNPVRSIYTQLYSLRDHEDHLASLSDERYLSY